MTSFRPRGFTLLEILVALAVMTIVVMGFLRGNSVMIANADYLRQKTLAHWVAMNRTAEIRLADQWLTGEGTKGIDLMGDRRWSWQATGKLSPDPEIQIITVVVRPADQQTSSPLASLTMFLAKPSTSGGMVGGS
jgi:general secretion pathway protein I